MLQGGNMDRVGAYNQRSSAYNMCGANEDDVVEPQRPQAPTITVTKAAPDAPPCYKEATWTV